MPTAATHTEYHNTREGLRFVAVERGETTWKLGFTTGQGQKPRERTVTARHQERVFDDIAQAKRRLGLTKTNGDGSGLASALCKDTVIRKFWL